MPHVFADGPPEVRAAAIATLVDGDGIPDAADLDALLACLGDARKLVQRRAAAAFAALAVRGVEVGDRLRAALGAPDIRLRWGVVYALSLIGPLPLDALPTLLDVMGLDDGDLRWAAAGLAKQLAATDRASVVARLLAAARQPGAQRKMALYSLRDLRVVEAFEVALDVLAEEHVETRLAALAVIAKVHPDSAVAARQIVALIDDSDPHVQRAAAGTLGGLGVKSGDVVGVLRRAADSTDPSLRRAAARSLRLLGSG